MNKGNVPVAEIQLPKANLEHILPEFGSSFFIKKYKNQFMFKEPIWHFHPEYEIVYITGGKGKRHIGNHISYYKDGDLIMIGPNLPHFGFTMERSDDYTEVVLQMKQDFLGKNFLASPEMMVINQLFERSKSGLTFHGTTKHVVGAKLMDMLRLKSFDRLMSLLSVLQELGASSNFESLNANSFTYSLAPEDEQRIQTIYTYVQNNYRDETSLKEISNLVGMTIPAFCRFFKKITNQTFVQFVNEFRIAYACKLLRDEDLLVIDIAHQAGYNNLSHFNKQFSKIVGMSPRAYKSENKVVVHLDNTPT